MNTTGASKGGLKKGPHPQEWKKKKKKQEEVDWFFCDLEKEGMWFFLMIKCK